QHGPGPASRPDRDGALRPRRRHRPPARPDRGARQREPRRADLHARRFCRAAVRPPPGAEDLARSGGAHGRLRPRLRGLHGPCAHGRRVLDAAAGNPAMTIGATGPRDDVRPETAHERLCGEIIDVLKTPLVCGLFEIDFTAVHALRRGLPAERAATLTDVTMVVAAAARALAKDPRLHTIHHRGRRTVPADVDVGLPVAGRGMLSPVTVVRGAQARSAEEIAEAIHGG